MAAERTIAAMVEEYNIIVTDKLDLLNTRLASATMNRKLYEKLILKSEEIVCKNKILSTIKANTKSYYGENDMYYMFKTTKLISNSNNVVNPDVVVYNSNLDYNKLILTQYENFKKYVYSEQLFREKIYKYELLQLSDRTLKYMAKYIFKHIAEFLLSTGKVFPLPYRILLKIIGKRRDIQFKKYGVRKSKVDWNESIKTLIAISKDIAPLIHTAYINKNITRKEFMGQMKPYTYNKDDRPNAPKWIVQDTNEIDFWLTTNTKYSSLNNSQKYVVVPNNGVAIKMGTDLGIERKQSEFMKLVKDKQEIITTNYLGFRDKLAMLAKYDLEFCKEVYRFNTI